MTNFEDHISHTIDNKTKPLGSLGKLEDLAKQICSIQQTVTPELKNPHMLVLAGDHGVARDGVSPFAMEVTPQMVINFVHGGAAINAFCNQHGINIKIVDCGVDYDFDPDLDIVHCKVGRGTANFAKEKAMTREQLDACLEKGAELVRNIKETTSCNIIGFGEMGIGNTSPSSMLMHKILNLPLAQCVGRGSGVSEEGFKNKLKILQTASELHGEMNDVYDLMQTYMGFEMAMMCGGFLEAKRQNMIIMIDGFIASSTLLCAAKIIPDITKNTVFCHQSDESGHKLLLEHFNGFPLVRLELRLGEGTGCAVAYPIIQSAVQFMNDMASFDSAGVNGQMS